MTTRITGMSSGLDTEALISELVKAKSVKVDKIKKDKTRLEWKQDAWKDLNKKVKSIYSGKISALRYSNAYRKKATSVSDSSAVSVITGEGAMNSVQSLSIKKLAKSGYLTGQEVQTESGEKAKKTTLISDLTLKDEDGNKLGALSDITGEGSFTVSVGEKSTKININSETTIAGVVSQLNAAGVSANFDEKNGRLFIGASGSGRENDFSITADNAIGLSAISVLGINADPAKEEEGATLLKYDKLASYYTALSGQDKDAAIEAITSDVDSEIYKMLKAEVTDEANPDYDAAYDKLMAKLSYANDYLNTDTSALYSKGAVRLEGSDAEIELNGATFTSSSNNIEVNGLIFQCKALADDIVVTTADDTDGIYDMIKDFFKEYNDLIVEMDKLYNAESSKGYEPLTDDEKDAMSDKEIEKWEDKIKDSILRKNETLGTLYSSMKDIMASGITVGDSTLYLASFGIATSSYFDCEEHERGVYHIDGDPDDASTSGNADKLKSMIASDPDSVVNFFTKLSATLYDKLYELSSSTSYSSFGSFYEDKQFKTDLAEYDTKIADAQRKLQDYEDKYYDKFSAMETALASLESKTSYLSNLFT